MKKLFLCVLLLLIAAAFVSAQSNPDKPQISTIRVSGEATVSVAPDQATMNMGVVTRSTNAAAAAAQNATKLERVLSEVRKLLGSKGQVKTTQYSLAPIYVYPPQGGEPKLTGYTASNTVEIKTDQLDLVGKLIDAGTQAGANSVDSLTFGLKDESQAQGEALKEASRKARTKAEAIAEALGVKIQRIVQVEEGGPVQVPLANAWLRGKAETMQADTPVEPGKVEIQATVSLTLEIQ
jgi:uncharacterized protein YggE